MYLPIVTAPMIPTSLEEAVSPVGPRSIPTGSMSNASVAGTGSNVSSTAGTLDEPISSTIMRDINSVKTKFKFVLFPSADRVNGLTQDWDLWGPFLLCLVLSVVLAMQAPDNQKGYVFALVYVIVWMGSAIVTFNAVLLKGNISFFQSLCVLGYSTLPLVIAALACWLLNRVISGPINLALKAVAIGFGLVWASKASVGFMSELVPTDRKTLAVYPVWLLYSAISWIVFLS